MTADSLRSHKISTKNKRCATSAASTTKPLGILSRIPVDHKSVYPHPAQIQMPKGYWIAHVTVLNPEQYALYAAGKGTRLKKAHVELYCGVPRVLCCMHVLPPFSHLPLPLPLPLTLILPTYMIQTFPSQQPRLHSLSTEQSF